MYKKIFDSKNATREEWLNVRKLGLGGSDMSAVLGVNQWRSPLDVWLDKTSDTVAEQESEPMYWGTILEDIVAQEFSKRTGYKVRNNNFTLQSEKWPYLLANIDREIVGLDAALNVRQRTHSRLRSGKAIMYQMPIISSASITWLLLARRAGG